MNEKLFWVGSEDPGMAGPKLLVAPVWRDNLIVHLRSQGILNADLVAEKLATYFRTLSAVDPGKHELELIGRSVTGW